MRKFLSIILAAVLTVASVFSVVGCAKSKTFKVVFETEGGVRVAGGALIQEVENAEQISLPILEREGYTFIDWDKVISEIKMDTVVKAVWEKNKFTVTFSVSEGEHQEESGAIIQTVKEGSELVLPVFVREGYTLSWDKNISDINSECTVNGIWTPKEYKISFKNTDGSDIEEIEDIKIKYDEKVPALPTLPNGEKKFVGWKINDGKPLSQGQVWKIDSDVEAIAVWTEYSKYVLSFDLDGGNQMNLPTTYTEGIGAVINQATREGYTFDGWVEIDKDGNAISQPQRVINIGKTETGDKAFKATWKVKSYTVNFSTISGEVDVETMTFTYGQTITELPVVSGNEGSFRWWKYNDKIIKVGEKWSIDESGIEVKAEIVKKFIFNLILTRKIGDDEIKVLLPTGAENAVVTSEDSPIILPTATAEKNEDYSFFCWKYKNDEGKYVKLAPNTTAKQSSFADLKLGDDLTVAIDLVAFCSVNGERKFVFNLNANGVNGNTSISGTIKNGEAAFELAENAVVQLPTAVPKDTQEYTFKYWRYKNDAGKWVKINSGTTLSQENFPDIDIFSRKTIKMELVAYYAPNWTGYY